MATIAFLGYIGSVDSRYSREGKQILSLSMKSGEDWHNVKIFDREVPTEELNFGRNMASSLATQIGKGTALYIEGDLRTETWETQGFGGAKKQQSRTVIYANRARVLYQSGELPLAHAIRDNMDVPEVRACIGWLTANVKDFRLPVAWEFTAEKAEPAEEPVVEEGTTEEIPF